MKYISIDPVTDKNYNNMSRRLKFKRKFERVELPLLIIKYDGVIATFAKDDLIIDT
jgi:hypothetical protein